jgi:predicted nucleotidyltransferase
MFGSMHSEIANRRTALAQLCRKYGVSRLEVFGSAARSNDFDPSRSDIDLLVSYSPAAKRDLKSFLGFADELERLFGRRVDLLERGAIEKSPNYIRRRAILRDVETVYG